MNDNTPSPDRRRVFSLPVRLYVECRLFILAADIPSAKRTAETVDLQDYFTFNPSSVVTDGEALLRIDDVITFPIVTTDHVDLRELPVSTYDPRDHPDWTGLKRS